MRAWAVICSWTLCLVLAAGCRAPLPPLPGAGSADQPAVQVGLLTPMTGELATFGKMIRNGAGLAFDEWNGRGGVAGERIQPVLIDAPCEAEKPRAAAERAIVSGVRFLVGGLCSEAAIPIARLADERGVLFIAANATHPLVTVDDSGATRRLAFRVAFAYPYQGRAAARFLLEELQLRQVAVMTNPADPFVRAVADEFSTAFVAGGGLVLTTTTYAAQDADFGPLVAAAIGSGAQALYVPDGYSVANRVGSALTAQGPSITLIGSELWDRRELDLKALDGAYFTAHYSPDAPDPTAQAWAGRYQSAFAVKPDTLAALGYDAANLLAAAMQQAKDMSPEAVAAALEELEYQGVTGHWRFDEQHNPLKETVILQVKDGRLGFVKSVSLESWPARHK
jgi:branched-chain amino acid transport system substrate-binding protein